MLNSLGTPVTVVAPGEPTIKGIPAKRFTEAARDYSEGPKAYVLLMMESARNTDRTNVKSFYLDVASYVTEQLLCDGAA